MAPILTHLELDILRKLVNGEAVSVSSHLRLRLEMAGVLRDRARGIVVTDAGKRLVYQRPAGVAASGPAPDPKVARGRRMLFRRKSIF
jgi:hypothetical protein